MDIETSVTGAVLAVCAAMLCFVAVPFYALRHVGPGKIPPLPRGKVSIAGFGLVDFVGVSVFFGFYALMWAASTMVEKKDLSEVPDLPARLVENLVIQGFQIGLVGALLFWRMNIGKSFGLRWRKDWYFVFFAPLVVLAMYTFMWGLDLVGYNRWILDLVGGEGQQDAVKLLANNKDPLTLGLMATVACVGAPLAEEVVFRGYIYAVIKRFTNIPFAVVFSALLFGAVHMNLPALLPLVVLGALLALIYEYTGSLWAPIAVHFCFNAGTTAIQILGNFNPELLEKMMGKDAGFILLW